MKHRPRTAAGKRFTLEQKGMLCTTTSDQNKHFSVGRLLQRNFKQYQYPIPSQLSHTLQLNSLSRKGSPLLSSLCNSRCSPFLPHPAAHLAVLLPSRSCHCFGRSTTQLNSTPLQARSAREHIVQWLQWLYSKALH